MITTVKLHLTKLGEMHPMLPGATAAEYGHRAAVGLERHEHVSGVTLETRLDKVGGEACLYWNSPSPGASAQLDFQRVTEDAAEAIALALVHSAHGWEVLRRLQRGEAADWLLRDKNLDLVALEVSGVDTGEDLRRLKDKLEQVGRVRLVDHRVACVVELQMLTATLETATA